MTHKWRDNLRRLQRALPLLIIALITLAAYSNSFNTPFVFDDTFRIERNAALHSGDFKRLLAPRVLIYTTLYANFKAGGLDTTPYHITNLAIHILAAWFLFGIITNTLGKSRKYQPNATCIALIASCLWAVHPLQTESVTYIIQRCESLTGLCMLLTLYCATRIHSSAYPHRWQIATVAAAALSMTTKEISIITPLLILLYEYAFRRQHDLKMNRGYYLALLLTPAVLVGLALLAPPDYGGDTAGFGFQAITPYHYALTQFRCVAYYLRLALYPSPLCIDLAWPVTEKLTDVIPHIMLMALLVTGSIYLLIRKPNYGFWAVWIFFLLSPSSSIMPIADVAVEHRMYLPLAGICVMAALLLFNCSEPLSRSQRRITRTTLSIAVIALLGLMTYDRNCDYASGEAIWINCIQASPNNARAYLNIGQAQTAKGDYATAIPYFEKAATLDKSDPRARYNLGLSHIITGNIDAGIAICHEAIPLSDYPEHTLYAKLNIAYGHILNGELATATEIYNDIISTTPVEWSFMTAEAHYRLGTLLERNDTTAAMGHYETAIKLSPTHALAHNDLALALQRKQHKD
jgi:tetratricopeptide (TPR) repeat protein